MFKIGDTVTRKKEYQNNVSGWYDYCREAKIPMDTPLIVRRISHGDIRFNEIGGDWKLERFILYQENKRTTHLPGWL